MSKDALKCIVCEKELRNVFDEAYNQPEDGLAFQSEGHYGSTAWDPMDGQFIEISVCDECLVKRAKAGFVLQGRNRRPVVANGVIVGWENVQRELVSWDGERGMDKTDVLKIAEDEVGADYLTETAEGRTRIEWNKDGS